MLFILRTMDDERFFPLLISQRHLLLLPLLMVVVVWLVAGAIALSRAVSQAVAIDFQENCFIYVNE